MRGLKTPVCLVVICCACWLVPYEVRSERSMSRAKLEKELRHLRESLHEAHRELGIKADRIAVLEAALNEKPAKKKMTPSKKPAVKEASSENEKKVKPQASGEGSCEEGKGTLAAGANGSGKVREVTEQIFYEQNSAVNYEGREKILRFVQRTLEDAPDARFSVIAWANDSSYRETDEDIAGNRARFLVDYLKIRGIPEEAFSTVRGEVSGKTGRNGRLARVRGVLKR